MEISIWAPIITFLVVLLAHFASRLVALSLRTTKLQPPELQLASEIKDLLRQASSLSSPSTYAKAAKLRRMAASKEKELAQLRQNLAKERRWSEKVVFPTALKAIIYMILGYCFWGHTISILASQNIQPFDKILLWMSKDCEDQNLTRITFLPWLAICTRVSAFLSKKALPT